MPLRVPVKSHNGIPRNKWGRPDVGLRRYTFRGRCDERPELTLPDRVARIFLNAVRALGDEPEDVRGFLDYVNTDTAAPLFFGRLPPAGEYGGAA